MTDKPEVPPITHEICGQAIDSRQAIVFYASEAMHQGSLASRYALTPSGVQAAQRQGKALGEAYGIAMCLVDSGTNPLRLVRRLLEAGVELGRVQS